MTGLRSETRDTISSGRRLAAVRVLVDVVYVSLVRVYTVFSFFETNGIYSARHYMMSTALSATEREVRPAAVVTAALAICVRRTVNPNPLQENVTVTCRGVKAAPTA